MRERFLEAFDDIRVDNLNGDKYKTGKTTPDGAPDPSIFSTPGDPVGIQVGTAITTLVRKADHKPAKEVGFRHLWGQAKLSDLTATAEAGLDELYDGVEPNLPLGLPFARTTMNAGWPSWPSLLDLFPAFFPGVQSKRDTFLVDIDVDRLRSRIADYFVADLSHEEVARRYPVAMKDSSGFVVPDARLVRDGLLARGGPNHTGFVCLAYRPFDKRWLYWDVGRGLLGRPVPNCKPHVFGGNLWLVLQNKARPDLSPPLVISDMGDLNQMNSGTYCVPLFLRDEGLGLGGGGTQHRPNLSDAAQHYLDRLGMGAEDLFHHVIAILHSSDYQESNADALRAEGPRVPMPGWSDGDTQGAAEELAASAARGRELAALLDSETPIPGVTTGPLRPEMAAIGVPSTVDGSNMAGEDFALTEGWGHWQGEAVMPGQGRVVERGYKAEEGEALGSAVAVLVDTTFDVYLNERAYWRNVPAAVWGYKLGGYPVLKKWLSYRERKLLGRTLLPEEVRHFRDTARRIAAILLETAPTSVREGAPELPPWLDEPEDEEWLASWRELPWLAT